MFTNFKKKQEMDDPIRSVLIEVDHSVFGTARCSGLQCDNVIIAHGTLLHFLCSNNDGNEDDSHNVNKNFQSVITELSKLQCFLYPEKHKIGEVDINFKVLKLNRPISKSGVEYSGNVARERSAGETYTSEDARLCVLYKSKEDGIPNEISNLGYIDGPYQNYNSVDPRPIFLFLMTGIPRKHLFEKQLYTLLKIVQETPIYPGLSIAVESTPFSSLAFYNSLSQGIISKTLGPDQEALLIDTRLVYGCEGAPIFVFDDGFKGALIGIVVCIYSRCEEECIGFSLGLNLKHLLKAVLGLKTNEYLPYKILQPPGPSSLLSIEQLSSAVIFVRCQHKWGSGVVVDADLGLVLTCSHIVHHAQDSVQVVFRGKKYNSLVEFASPPSEPYDLALLSVGKIPGLKSLPMAKTSPFVGESVITVGYALSTESSVIANGTPTLSGGCVAKVSHRGGPLQTTCCTQSGMSGGAVLRPPDQLIGIVVSNIRVGSTVLPFFSFAVSVDDFRAAIAQFVNTKDPNCLKPLSVRSPEVKMRWMLQESKL